MKHVVLKTTMQPNTIHEDFRFAKRDKVEYHVFSLHVQTPDKVENWMAVQTEHNVLIDPQTFEDLKNTRIEWSFDENNVLVACKKL
jgi:hypothetical protein